VHDQQGSRVGVRVLPHAVSDSAELQELLLQWKKLAKSPLEVIKKEAEKAA
jgi:hypothetical protein